MKKILIFLFMLAMMAGVTTVHAQKDSSEFKMQKFTPSGSRLTRRAINKNIANFNQNILNFNKFLKKKFKKLDMLEAPPQDTAMHLAEKVEMLEQLIINLNERLNLQHEVANLQQKDILALDSIVRFQDVNNIVPPNETILEKSNKIETSDQTEKMKLTSPPISATPPIWNPFTKKK